MDCRLGAFLALVDIVCGISTTVSVGNLGTVIGIKDYTKWNNRAFYSFRNIPFAEPPIDDLRYRPPVKVTTWNGSLDATKFGNICPQTKQLGYHVEGYDEDCLQLNVYVPAESIEPIPVMIYLHGGSFMSGHASRFQPHYLLESDIILVVPQFRLGPLGLLSLQTDEVPGNVQFLDQIMAMQWVQENIGYFGGNKNRVTLFGQSSGGYSINLHLISPLAKKLFHQTVIQSMSVFTAGMVDHNPVTSTTEIANLLGCNTNTVEIITECMKKLSARAILVGFDKYMMLKSREGTVAYGGARAVIQKAGEFKFLTDEPQDLVTQGNYTKLPMMGGVTRQDGSFVISSIYEALLATKHFKDADFLENNLIEFLLHNLAVPDPTSGVSHILKNMYFSNGEIGDFIEMVPGLIDISSVFLFKAGVYKMLYENSRSQNSYLYTFDHHGSQTRFGYESGKVYPFGGGVAHSDDLIYLFPFPDKLSAADTRIAKRMVQLWTNFAITGAPCADDVRWWPEMSTRTGPYLKIGSSVSTGDNFIDEYTVTIREGLHDPKSSVVIPISNPVLVACTLYTGIRRYMNNWCFL